MTNEGLREPTSASLDRSRELLDRSLDLIPGGTQTNSKGPTQWVRGVAPTHMERGEGSHVWDVDGNEYIDYPMARGPVTLGHGYPPVTEAVRRRASEGTAFSTPHRLQVEVAEAVVDAVPCAEMVKFAKNGNDVTALAAKVARAHTGRDVIATQGYHGWPDVWMGNTARNAGIPDPVGEFTASFEYNDLASLERVFEEHPGDVAAIVTTPVNYAAPEDGFLEGVRDIADREDAVLVFDEIITGFRFALGGAQEYFGVTPDLACFAKGIANGYPLSALAGRADVMRTIDADDFVFSTTYGGEALALSASAATLQVLREDPVFEHLFDVGERLIEGYNDLVGDHGLDAHTECVGFPPRSQMTFTDAGGVDARHKKSLVMQECLERGVLFAAIQFPTYSHTDDDVEHTLSTYDEALGVLADALAAGDVSARLEGPPVGTPLTQSL